MAGCSLTSQLPLLATRRLLALTILLLAGGFALAQGPFLVSNQRVPGFGFMGGSEVGPPGPYENEWGRISLGGGSASTDNCMVQTRIDIKTPTATTQICFCPALATTAVLDNATGTWTSEPPCVEVRPPRGVRACPWNDWTALWSANEAFAEFTVFNNQSEVGQMYFFVWARDSTAKIPSPKPFFDSILFTNASGCSGGFFDNGTYGGGNGTDGGGGNNGTDGGGNTTTNGDPPTGSVLINCGANSSDTISVHLSITAKDPDGVSMMCISNTADTVDYCQTWSNFTAFSDWDLQDGDPGERTVYVYLSDSLGNTMTAPISDTIYLTGYGDADVLPPEAWLTIAADATGQVKNLTTSLTIQGTDDSGITEMCVSNTAAQLDECTMWQEYAPSIENWSLVPGEEGKRTVFLYLRDTLNNTMVIPAKDEVFFFTGDTEPPQGTVTINGGAAETTTPNVTLSIAATDASAIDLVCISNNSAITAADCVWLPFNETIEWTLEGPNGVVSLFVLLRDAKGNTMAAPISASIILNVPDTAAPEGSFVINGGVPLARDLAVTLTINATDNASNISAMCIGNDPVDASNCTWEPFQAVRSGWLLANGTDGDRTVYILLQDAANNTMATPMTATITYEVLGVVTGLVVNDGSGLVKITTVTLYLNATGATSKTLICISYDGQYTGPSSCPVWQAFAAKKVFKLAPGAREGNVSVAVFFRDLAVKYEPAVAEFTYDVSPPNATQAVVDPRVTMVPLDAAPTPTVNVTFNRVGIDLGSGVASWLVTSKKGAMPLKCVPYNPTTNTTQLVLQEDGGLAQLQFDNLAMDSIYGFRVCPVDKVNNIGSGVKAVGLAPGNARSPGPLPSAESLREVDP